VLNPVPFLYLRHGQTDWNARNVSQGNVDIPLNETGRAQAVQAAALLQGRGITAIVASPLSRARDTAATVGDALGLKVAIDEGLREVAFGVQEGQPMSEWFHDWVAERFVPEGGEPFAALRERAAAAINRATARAGLVLVVGHGAFFRAVRSAAGLTADVRTQNAQPLRMEPPAAGETAWRLAPVE
jgi:probable phosphoglycerate mutase